MSSKKLSRGCIAVILCIISTAISVAQGSGSVRGRVIDQTTGEPLIGANVIVIGTSIGAATDFEGNFYLRVVPAGKRTIRVSYIGYEESTKEIIVSNGVTEQLNFTLTPRAIEGEAVIVTAQMKGQDAAINQQLTSNTIANIVAADRIRELPDVNAAESIGRLPGVAIARSGGEATKVIIRGLSPKYNLVTVNGMPLPATGGDDRSTDLSLISSNMLGGIELKKAMTPDMDADFLGGVVDLKLKEAPENFETKISLQGGYNKLQNYHKNYNITASIGNRFFDGVLGVLVNVNADNYDRSADKLSAEYREQAGAVGGIMPNNLQLREEILNRKRAGGSINIDVRIPYGKVTLNGMYNQLNQEGLNRVDRMDLSHASHYYDFEKRKNRTEIFTTGFGGEQDFGWIKYDLGVSYSGSRAKNPEDYLWGFVQENGAYSNTNVRFIRDIQRNTTPLDSMTGLRNIFVEQTTRRENQATIQLNLQSPFHIATFFNGYVKIGGKFKYLDRLNDEERWGRDNFQYGSTGGVSAPLASLLKKAASLYPENFNWRRDSSLVRQCGVMPIIPFLTNYARRTFLNDYYFPFSVDENILFQATDALRSTPDYLHYSMQSIGRDYDGIERYYAAYAMSEVQITEYATLLGGVRWEQDYSVYNGQRYRQVVIGGSEEKPPADLADLRVERKNRFLLPQVLLTLKPAEWAKIRFASTQTLTRPDYMMYAPITYINSYMNYMRAANSKIKPARSYNYDVALSVYNGYTGLFSATAFYKRIKDLIMQTTIYYQRGMILPDGLNIPSNWITGYAPQIDTYINIPGKAEYRGYELEWQTNFWYLPIPFKGIVLNVNYTRIWSKVESHYYLIKQGDYIPGVFPRIRYKILVDTFRIARMPDQPAHTLNATIGYDIGGFSARLSYLYQADRTRFLTYQGQKLDQVYADYWRMDLVLQQKLSENVTLFANFNNLNARDDESYTGQYKDYFYIERYGFTVDVGMRFNF
ncbi:MAG: TonB-dependent receptor [Bacteroidetes bacterium]|nr:TonB-dependent receptor [Bacteroidota bacterium]